MIPRVQFPKNLRLDDRHRYWLGRRELTAVSTLLKEIKPKFDAPMHAKRVAQRTGRTTQAVLAEWDKKRDDASEKGDALHAAVHATLTKGGYQGPLTAELAHWLKWWRKVGQNLSHVGSELKACHERWRIAGTIDLLAYSRKTSLLHIIDWKTNCRFESANRYGTRLLPPFSDLDECEMETYSLQVSCYRLMVEERTGHKCGPSMIVWVGPDGVQAFQAHDYRARLREWLDGREPETLF